MNFQEAYDKAVEVTLSVVESIENSEYKILKNAPTSSRIYREMELLEECGQRTLEFFIEFAYLATNSNGSREFVKIKEPLGRSEISAVYEFPQQTKISVSWNE